MNDFDCSSDSVNDSQFSLYLTRTSPLNSFGEFCKTSSVIELNTLLGEGGDSFDFKNLNNSAVDNKYFEELNVDNVLSTTQTNSNFLEETEIRMPILRSNVSKNSKESHSISPPKSFKFKSTRSNSENLDLNDASDEDLAQEVINVSNQHSQELIQLSDQNTNLEYTRPIYFRRFSPVQMVAVTGVTSPDVIRNIHGDEDSDNELGLSDLVEIIGLPNSRSCSVPSFGPNQVKSRLHRTTGAEVNCRPASISIDLRVRLCLVFEILTQTST